MRVKDVVAKKLKILRMSQGWTQKDLARRIGVSVSTIAHIEACDQFPSEPLIGTIAEVFGIEETDLFRLKSEAGQASEPRRSGVSEKRAKLILKEVADALGYKMKSVDLEAA
ncbi:XRE family transcriptional regulator [bacterium]|nr:XRE family transcriptional regulator [bacterium]